MSAITFEIQFATERQLVILYVLAKDLGEVVSAREIRAEVDRRAREKGADPLWAFFDEYVSLRDVRTK